jgi:hypothetical protein
LACSQEPNFSKNLVKVTLARIPLFQYWIILHIDLNLSSSIIPLSLSDHPDLQLVRILLVWFRQNLFKLLIFSLNSPLILSALCSFLGYTFLLTVIFRVEWSLIPIFLLIANCSPMSIIKMSE